MEMDRGIQSYLTEFLFNMASKEARHDDVGGDGGGDPPGDGGAVVAHDEKMPERDGGNLDAEEIDGVIDIDPQSEAADTTQVVMAKNERARSKSTSNFVSYVDDDGLDQGFDATPVIRPRKGRKKMMFPPVFLQRKSSLQDEQGEQARSRGRTFSSSLRRSQSSREVRHVSSHRRLNLISEASDSFDATEAVHDGSSRSAAVKSFVSGGLKRNLTMSSMSSIVSGWNKSFRQKLHERAQSFRNLDRRNWSNNAGSAKRYATWWSVMQ